MTKVTALKPIYFEGKRYAIGEKLEMSEPYATAYLRDKHVIASGTTTVEVPVETETFSTDEEELAVLLKMWDAPMTPTEYLQKFPDGPESTVALRIIELVAEEAELAQK